MNQMKWNESDVLRALSLSEEAHSSIDQRRKYSGESYFDGHIKPVVNMAREAGLDYEDQIVLAFHDVIEDVTPLKPMVYNEAWILSRFDAEILAGVIDLTDVYTKAAFPDWNRKKRHAAELERQAKLPVRSKNRKLIDTLHNTEDIVFVHRNHPQAAGFAPVYLREKMEMLSAFTDADPILYRRAVEQINAGLAQVGHPSVIYG